MIQECLILAGGFGTRLRSIVSNVPKPMALIQGKPFLEYLLKYLSSQGITKVVLSVGYLREKIINYFGKHFAGMEIVYSIEDEPLGTGGAILKAKALLGEAFFIVNGDTLFKLKFSELYEFFKQKEADIVLALKPMKNCERYGSVEIDANGRVIGFVEKAKLKDCLINGGVYVVSNKVLTTDFTKDFQAPFSWERDFLERRYKELKIYGLVCDGYFIDIGTPEDYKRAIHELKGYFK
ncbi:MAG: nucleotidyltransferase family protein [Thermodesulfobacterium sp.]|nr:nucleotidyltransferase family protein [Thermodesulfobacterium sp.]MDW8136537.1 nucleotidyltransferase family protein [Thermodesulfobacterium sp.]